jgi:hypothetical protein
MNHGKDNIDNDQVVSHSSPRRGRSYESGINADASSIHPGPARHKRRIVSVPGALSEEKGLGQKSFGCPLVKDPDRGKCGREDGCPSLQVTHSFNRIAPYSGGDDNVAGLRPRVIPGNGHRRLFINTQTAVSSFNVGTSSGCRHSCNSSRLGNLPVFFFPFFHKSPWHQCTAPGVGLAVVKIKWTRTSVRT